MNNKTCPRCKQEKSISEFPKGKASKDGLFYLCKECAKQKSQKYRDDNPEKVKSSRIARRIKRAAYDRQWRTNHPEQFKEQQKRWRINHIEQYKEYQRKYCRKYRLEHLEQLRAKERERRKTRILSDSDKEKGKQRARRYYARKKSNGDIGIEGWNLLLDYFGNMCLRCGSIEHIEIDHVIPISLGGPHHITNVQPLCKVCNAQKGATIKDYRLPDNLKEFLAILAIGS